jgi:hypothetical protein
VTAQQFTGVSGLLMVIALPLTVTLPYVLRRGPLARQGAAQGAAVGAKSLSFLQRMRPHYWLGYGIAGLTLVHALVAMSGGLALAADPLRQCLS